MLNTILSARRLLVSFLLIGVGQNVASAQGATNGSKACAMLTRQVVEKFSAASRKGVDPGGPQVLSLGANGTACEWGDVTLQVDPWPPARLEAMRKSSGKDWEVIEGVGDAAYLHNIRDMMAELFVRVGGRTFAVLVSIPAGSTTAAFKPSIIGVADAIAPKLR